MKVFKSQKTLAGRMDRGCETDDRVLVVVAALVYPGGVGRRARGHVYSGCGRRRGRRDRVVGRTHHVVVVVHRIPVLAVVELLAHHVLEVAAPEVQDLPEGFAKVAVQGRVDHRVQETVAVAEPEEDARQVAWYVLGIV